MFSSSLAVLLALLALEAALVTPAAGRPWGPWANTTLQNTQEEEGVTIPLFLQNFTSPLDVDQIRQYAAIWENHTLDQYIDTFCRDANLDCNSNISIGDPQLFEGIGAPYLDGEALQFGERHVLEGKDIVLPKSLYGFSNPSPSFLPDVLAKKIPLSSENIEELLDTFHILHNSRLAKMMVHTINRCKVVKKNMSKEIKVTKEKKIKEKKIVASKESGNQGKKIGHKEKESKENGIDLNNKMRVKENKINNGEGEKETTLTLGKAKEIIEKESTFSKKSITKISETKIIEKGKGKEGKKDTVRIKEKKRKEKKLKKRESKQRKEKGAKGKECKRKKIEQQNEKEIKDKKLKPLVHKSSEGKKVLKGKESDQKVETNMKIKGKYFLKKKSSEGKKGKEKEIEYKREEVKEEEKKVEEKIIDGSEKKSHKTNIANEKGLKYTTKKEMRENDFLRREVEISEGKKVVEKEISERKKQMEVKEKYNHIGEEKLGETKIVKEKEIIYKKEKESKVKDFHVNGKKTIKNTKGDKKEIKTPWEERKTMEEGIQSYKEKWTKDEEEELQRSKEVEAKTKGIHGSKEKSSEVNMFKEKEIVFDKEKGKNEKDTYSRKKESSKEIGKCVTSLEEMTSFVKKSLSKGKRIKALERSSSLDFDDKDYKKIKWKVLGYKKYDKAVICKSNIFLFAIYECHDISKIESKFIYSIELRGIGGVHRKEILECERKKKFLDSMHREAKMTSTLEASCQWVRDSLVWTPSI